MGRTPPSRQAGQGADCRGLNHTTASSLLGGIVALQVLRHGIGVSHSYPTNRYSSFQNSLAVVFCLTPAVRYAGSSSLPSITTAEGSAAERGRLRGSQAAAVGTGMIAFGGLSWALDSADPGGRLVEQSDVRLRDQRAHQRQFLFHAAAQTSRETAG